MKKLGLLICSFIILILGLIIYVIYNDNSYLNGIKNKIINNTEIKNIEYINDYDNYYIVLDDNNLYLLDNEYNIVFDIEKFLIHKNDNNYDIIYNDKHFMYFNDRYENETVTYEYYDIYTYELLKKVIVGGKDGASN